MQKENTVKTWAWECFRGGAGRWEPSTEGGYRNLIERHIAPGIGKVKLETLKPVHINRFYAELAEKGLSAKSVWCVHLLLHRILDATCKEGLIDINPADFCKVPDGEKKPTFRLRQSQLRRYPDAAEGNRVLPIIYIGLTVALRQCELFTLLWADFDLERRYILLGKCLLMLGDRATELLEAEHTRHPDIPYAFLNPKTGCTSFTICTESSPPRRYCPSSTFGICNHNAQRKNYDAVQMGRKMDDGHRPTEGAALLRQEHEKHPSAELLFIHLGTHKPYLPMVLGLRRYAALKADRLRL